jgi:hypothetical protein
MSIYTYINFIARCLFFTDGLVFSNIGVCSGKVYNCLAY